MNPITNKTVAKTITTGLEQGPGNIRKNEPSKFDKVRSDRLEKASSVPVDLPPAVTQVSASQKQVLESQLSQRAQQTSTSPSDVLKVDLGNTKVSLNQLSQKVSALPNTQAFDPIRTRFANIEQQYNNTGQLLSNVGKTTNQQDLLSMQMQMYLMTENIQLVSKVVDQVTSGVKTMLQTQI